MTKKSEKFTVDFNKMYESYFSRYTAGTFGIGDVIQFDKGILSDPMFKELNPELKLKLQGMVEASLAGDAIIAVTKTDLDPRLVNHYEPATITIAYSQGGGLFYQQTTIPGSLGKYMTVVGEVYSKLPKHAVKPMTSGSRQKVDMNKVKDQWKNGAVEDVRLKKQA